MTLRDVSGLVDAGLVAADEADGLAEVAARYAVAVPEAVAALVDRADPDDPIRRQFVPDRRELLVQPEERLDPIGDEVFSPCEGLVHRYPDRVLLKLAQVCAVYCRFCFRREMVGPGRTPALSTAALEQALGYVAARSDIWEVILTGGDPLTVAARRLTLVARRLAAMTHVRILRVHTRLPIVAPERIDKAIVAALSASGKTVYVAIHANHPRELTPSVRAACDRLTAAGFVLVSQTVLLRGINDDAATLAELMRAFVEARIKPYYLHHPDLAPGTAHFRLTIAEGQALVAALRGRLSGLCQPTYVLDIPGGHGKSPIGPTYVEEGGDGTIEVQDFQGRTHAYPPRDGG